MVKLIASQGLNSELVSLGVFEDHLECIEDLEFVILGHGLSIGYVRCLEFGIY